MFKKSEPWKCAAPASRLAACAREWRNPLFVEHPLEQLFSRRVFAIAAGYEDGNDHLALRDDPLFQLCAARPGKRLAFGTTTGNVYVSENRGESWKSLGSNFPPVYSVRFA